MISTGTMLRLLPPFRGDEDWIKDRQSIRDIVKEVLAAHVVFEGHYDAIASQWAAIPQNRLLQELFQWCRTNLVYREEKEAYQTTRSPAGTIAMRIVDCKHYAGFIAGILDAINRMGGSWQWTYRFASYNLLALRPGHVFVVVKDPRGREVWIDPVPQVQFFNARSPSPVYSWNKIPDEMSLVRLSGIDKKAAIGKGFTSQHLVNRSDLSVTANCIRGMRKKTSVHALSGYSGMYGIPAGFTPDQLGIPYFQKVFNLQNLIPGAADAIALDPPITFWSGGKQMPLPPLNTIGPSFPVPSLPADLQVIYASSFMGVTIPSNFMRPVVVSGKLQCAPWQITTNPAQYFSMDGALTAATNSQLLANGKMLAWILISAFGAIIQSYSPYPYGNDSSGIGRLSMELFNTRNKADFLYPAEPDTLLQSAVKVFGNVILPAEAAVVNLIVPGAGTAGLNLQQKALAPITTNPNNAVVTPKAAPTGTATPAGGSPSTSSTILQTIEANPIPAALIGGGILFLLYTLLGDHKKRSA